MKKGIMMRINKFIARSGYTSRRKADELILAGEVFVNGKMITELGFDVSDFDQVVINGKTLEISKKFYKKLYKPIGFITSNYDPYNKKDLNSLVKMDERFFAAGRLDKDSEGLLIITNDGEFTNEIIHPSKKLEKTYLVKTNKKLTISQEKRFEQGLDLGRGEVTSNSKISLLNSKTNEYMVIIHQGYNRQIRRMFAFFSIKVLNLKRLGIGPIKLDDMKEFEIRDFDNKELEFVRKVRG